MIKNVSSIISALLISLLIVSCATQTRKPQPTQSSASDKKLFAKAKRDMSRGRTRTALANYKRIYSNKNSDLADNALLEVAKYYYKKRNYETAYKFALEVIDLPVFTPDALDAKIISAQSLQRLGRYDESLSVVRSALKTKPLAAGERFRLEELRYKIVSSLGDSLESLQSLVFLSKSNSPKSASYKLKASELIETQLSERDLRVVRNRSYFGEFKAIATYQLGRIYFEQREYSRAADAFSDVVSLAPESSLAEQANRSLNQIRARRRVAAKTIGVILPLSGKHKKMAEDTLRGLQMGLGVFSQRRSEFKLAVMNSQGNPDAARRAVERLVTEDNVVAIVGSLLSKTASAVSSKANELGVPNITLTQKNEISLTGDFVFQNAFTRSQMIETVVRQAVQKNDLKRFAILYPNDAYGVGSANVFWDNVEKYGGKITAAQSYESKETDFGSSIQRLVGTFFLEGRKDEYSLRLKDWYQENGPSRRKTPPTDLLPPIVDFDAIFVPDSTRALGQIAPMLAYNEIKDVTLIGTNLWNTNSLIKRGGGTVENALFVDGFIKNDSNFLNSTFYRDYYNMIGRRPGLFALLGYESGLVLRNLLMSGSSSREQLRDRLARLNDFPGAIGPISVSDDREWVRNLVLLTVQDGKITKAK